MCCVEREGFFKLFIYFFNCLLIEVTLWGAFPKTIVS